MTKPDKKFMLGVLGKTKILPGVDLGGAKFHVCSDNPVMSAVNHSAHCFICGKPVYFSMPNPGLKKVCVDCVRRHAQKNGELEYVTNERAARLFLTHFNARN